MPEAKYLLVAAVVAVLAVAAFARRRLRRGGGPMVTQTRVTAPLKGSLDAGPGGRSINVALGRELLPLLEEGRTDEAVALVRGRTGWGEEEARASVERLAGLMKRLGME